MRLSKRGASVSLKEIRKTLLNKTSRVVALIHYEGDEIQYFGGDSWQELRCLLKPMQGLYLVALVSREPSLNSGLRKHVRSFLG